MKKIYYFSLFFVLCFSNLFGEEPLKVRIGHFPNITHAQALIGHHSTRQGKGWFEKELGPNVTVEWSVYNAGPSAMEGIFTDAIDLVFVGPSPTINAYIKSKGEFIRIVCGSCSGGAALVVQGDGAIKTDADFKGKKVGTPQFGNTQDIAARAWLRSKGFNVTLTGGDVFVIPTDSADQLLLFKKGDLDAVWTIEPWVSRLILEAKGKIYLEESSLWKETQGKYVTAHIVCSKKFIDEHPDIVKKIISVQIDLIEWIKNHPDEAKKIVQDEIKAETRVAISQELLNHAWKKIELTYDPIPLSLYKYAEDAFEVGLLREKPDLDGIYDLSFLQSALKDNKIPKRDHE